LIDRIWAGNILMIVGHLCGLKVEQWNLRLILWLSAPVLILFEAVSLSLFKTTPGKWLFNIWLLEENGDRLPFQVCLQRACAVFKRGEGFGIPLISYITQAVAYIKLERHGRTTWDADYQVIVRHEKLGVGRIVGIIAALVLIVTLADLSRSLK
jgi:hypothetical protein